MITAKDHSASTSIFRYLAVLVNTVTKGCPPFSEKGADSFIQSIEFGRTHSFITFNPTKDNDVTLMMVISRTQNRLPEDDTAFVLMSAPFTGARTYQRVVPTNQLELRRLRDFVDGLWAYGFDVKDVPVPDSSANRFYKKNHSVTANTPPAEPAMEVGCKLPTVPEPLMHEVSRLISALKDSIENTFGPAISSYLTRIDSSVQLTPLVTWTAFMATNVYLRGDVRGDVYEVVTVLDITDTFQIHYSMSSADYAVRVTLDKADITSDVGGTEVFEDTQKIAKHLLDYYRVNRIV